MLVRLSIGQWSARKFDSQATKAAVDKLKAASDAGRFNKILMSSESLDEIAKLGGEARKEHYRLTLPWFDDGSRILPNVMYLDYTKIISAIHTKREAAVHRFMDEYDNLILKAKNFLGDMFDAQDYPNVKVIADKFSFDYWMYPIPSRDDFRVDLLNGSTEKIQEEIEKRVNDQLKSSMNDCWERLHDVVSNMTDKLSQPEAQFKDSLVDNIKDLLPLLKKLNITGDQNLIDTMSVIERKLCVYPPQTLRATKQIRTKVADEAKDILTIIKEFKKQ